MIVHAVEFISGDRNHRQEIDSLYNAVQQLMAGYVPHFLLPHANLKDILAKTQAYLQQRQPHMTLSRLDFVYYYSEASFKTFRKKNVVFLVIDAPVFFHLIGYAVSCLRGHKITLEYTPPA